MHKILQIAARRTQALTEPLEVLQGQQKSAIAQKTHERLKIFL
ncbi:MAG: hypothetical protein ONB44_23060 [candidate division KSB1 bacterium]|nr:hypothetical protein [candidate division KSB1 bacterium]MDZ7305020.1 hypothetical protein [candidate division KSB1 bacterium]